LFKSAFSKLPDQVHGENMGLAGAVFALKVAPQWTALLVDPGFVEIDKLVGGSHGHVPGPVVLNAGADSDLAIQRRIDDIVRMIQRSGAPLR
jgi:hypothetical protein